MSPKKGETAQLRSCFSGSCHVGVSKRFSRGISLAVYCHNSCCSVYIFTPCSAFMKTILYVDGIPSFNKVSLTHLSLNVNNNHPRLDVLSKFVSQFLLYRNDIHCFCDA